MTGFRDADGKTQQVDVSLGMYQEAAKAGVSLQHYVNMTYPTDAAKYGPAWNQMLASEGIYLQPNRELGIRPSTMKQILEGPQAGSIVKDGFPASRILFPAVILGVVEDKLLASLTMTSSAFEKMIAVDESINGERYEQPVLNFARPEAARSQGISQLARPASMMTITSSDKAYKIPTFSLGLEVADQALAATTIDFVALSLARQAAVERNERAQNYVLALLNGDVDNNDGTLASLGLSATTTSLDSAATGGIVTQKAWIKYLMLNGTKRVLSHIITDFDTALKIENRTNKPIITNDDSKTSRFDTQFNVMNPTWAKNPDLFLTDIAAWPANTIMGLDKNFAVRRVRSLTADYQAVEAYVMRRSTQMRFDFGEHVNRLYTDAFQVMTVA
jgi:hypothetical protein